MGRGKGCLSSSGSVYLCRARSTAGAGAGQVWCVCARMLRALKEAGTAIQPDQRVVPVGGVGSVVADVSGCVAPTLQAALWLLVGHMLLI